MAFGRRETGQANRPIFEIWGLNGWANVDVVGESFHEKEIRAHLPSRIGSGGDEAVAPVTMVHDPGNSHDSNAVEIRSSNGVLGHLSREDAARYAPYLARIQTSGLTAQTTARIWGRLDEDWETGRPKFWGNVRVELPEPHMLVPVNALPDGAVQMLPVGGAIQVTGEERYLDALLPFLNIEGSCWVYATVTAFSDEGSRNPKRLVEVLIDNATVGRLTPKMSSELLPAIDYLAARGKTTCVRAVVKGNRLKAEVTLHAQRAHEIPAAWFGEVDREHARPVDSESSRSQLAPNAGLPTPTPQLPPADWYPDPHGIARLRYWDGQQWTGHTAE